jgi:exonuclease SbcD
MRFLHTADWHLGRTLAGFDLLEAQSYSLEALLEIARESKVDAIVLAGDIYDRAVPPEQAVKLFDEHLERLRRIAPVLAIAGNHDSGNRIDFGRILMREANVFFSGTAWGGGERVDLRDDFGLVAFHLMPFAIPVEVRSVIGDDAIRNHETACAARISRFDMVGTQRHVLVGHLFADGGNATPESERDIAVGGVASVPTSLFRGFCYTALGHLHRAHHITEESIRYSGSICRYSFAEETHEKSVSLIEIDAVGGVKVEAIPLPQKYGMRTLRGELAQLERESSADNHHKLDLIRAVLTDRPAIPDAHSRLKRIYPNLLESSQECSVNRPPSEGESPTPPTLSDLRAISPQQQLEQFFRDRFNDQVSDDEMKLARECMSEAILERETL